MGIRRTAMGRMNIGSILKKLSPYTIQKGLRYLKHYGPREFWIRLHERFEPEEVPYGPWYEIYKASPEELSSQRERCADTAASKLFIPDAAYCPDYIPGRAEKERKAAAPLFSIAVPVYHTPAGYLKRMIESVQNQTYPRWELCIADGGCDEEEPGRIVKRYAAKDSRIRYRALPANQGISGNTNEALSMCRGDFVCFLDHDDLISPDALYGIASALSFHPECDLVYTDEDKVRGEEEEHFQPHLKPDFNPDLLRSNNYICHFLVVGKALLSRTGGFREAFDGAQDYDFILRCTENAKGILHVPEILYHWRTHSSSTADNPISKLYAYEAGKRAIEEHLTRLQLEGEVSHTKDFGFYRVKYLPGREEPLVSIIIPNKDQAQALKSCVEAVLKISTYRNFEILVVENNSTEAETFRYYRSIKDDPQIRLLRWKKPFNYSAINNYAAGKARGDYYVFLNNDVRVFTPDWIQEMLGVCRREDVGAVGTKLLYPDHTIQHAGCVIGMGGIAGSLFTGMSMERTGYLHKASLLQDLSAVTAACMMVKASAFHETGGFEEKLAVAFNDMDFCLRLARAGYRVVYDPYAPAWHDESRTRGAEDSKEKVRRFQTEIDFMRDRWDDILRKGDPNYNRNLSLTKWNYSLRPLQK